MLSPNAVLAMIVVFNFIGSFLIGSSIFASFSHDQEVVKQYAKLFQFMIIISLGFSVFLFQIPVIEIISFIFEQYFIQEQKQDKDQDKNTYFIQGLLIYIFLLYLITNFTLNLYWHVIQNQLTNIFEIIKQSVIKIVAFLLISTVSYLYLNKSSQDKAQIIDETQTQTDQTQIQSLSYIQTCVCVILLIGRLALKIILSFGLVDLIFFLFWKFINKPKIVDAVYMVISKLIIKNDMQNISQSITNYKQNIATIDIETDKEIQKRMIKSQERLKKEIDNQFKGIVQKVSIYDDINDIGESTLLIAYGNLIAGIILIIFIAIYLIDQISIFFNVDNNNNSTFILETFLSYLLNNHLFWSVFFVIVMTITIYLILFIEIPKLYGVVYKISFTEYQKDATYMNVFLMSSSLCILCSIGYIEYLSQRIDYFKQMSYIDFFIDQMSKKSLLIQTVLNNQFEQVISVIVVFLSLFYQLTHRSSRKQFQLQIKQEIENYKQQKLQEQNS